MTGYILARRTAATQASPQESTEVNTYLPAQNLFAVYNLKWRKNTLWVSLDTPTGMMPEQILVEQIFTRLEHSAVRCVCIDPKAGEIHLKAWAEACKKAGRPLYLRVPGGSNPQYTAPSHWRTKRLLDVSATILGGIILSPILCAIALLVGMSSPGPVVYRQWRVGNRGKLYQVWKFRSMVANADPLQYQVMGQQEELHQPENDPRITPIGRWLLKYHLDELPQLINVLSGEMSLVGPRPWALYDALRIPEAGLERLRAMPGITGEWQVMSRSNLRDMAPVTACDLDYLEDWSIGRDFRLLMMTFPKVLTGLGAHQAPSHSVHSLKHQSSNRLNTH